MVGKHLKLSDIILPQLSLHQIRDEKIYVDLYSQRKKGIEIIMQLHDKSSDYV